MILTDAGPLVALLDRKDPNHQKCVAAVKHLPPGSLLTTWPSFTEAMHLIYRNGGPTAQNLLWKMLQANGLLLHDLDGNEIERMRILMERYQDTPMDLADASLVAAAEQLGLTRIFTLDRDFFIYRLADGNALEVVPGRE